MMKRSLQGAAVGAMAAIALAAPAAGAGTDRQTASSTWTTTEPGAAFGSHTTIVFRNPDDPNAKPQALQTFISRFPDGTAIDTTVPEQCKASDAELMAQGTSACPPGSKIGSGTLVTDIGQNPLVPRFITYRLTLFNNQDEIVQVADQIDPPMQPGFRNVGRGKIQGETVTSDIPAFPSTLDPNNPFTAFTKLDFTIDPITNGDRAYLRTPPSCPAGNAWKGSFTFVYHDGVTQSVDVATPCRPASSSSPGSRHAGHPRIRLHRAPRHGCVSRHLSLRVSVSDTTSTALYLDRRRIARSGKRAFKRHISMHGLRRGRHVVVVRSGSAKRSFAFRRC